jgi:acyl-CoA synthetase (AMP-forming)/AMP-acid ligase II
LAATLAAAGLKPGDTVAQYLYNCPEYLETVFAAFKARLVPMNTNYRYLDDELVYVWSDAGAAAIVFDAAFEEVVKRVRPRLPTVRTWIRVGNGDAVRGSWAIDYEDAVASREADAVRASGDDRYLLYTGGTTGLPRGVVWLQRDLVGYLGTASPTAPGRPELDPPGAEARIHLPACPLMHGTGSFTAFQALMTGGCVVTLTGTSFDPEELLSTVDDQRVTSIALVGDAFCVPILEALSRHSERWRFDAPRWIVSSGVTWSAEVKTTLLAHNPRLILVDSLASSEAPGMATAVASAEVSPVTAQFTPGPGTVLVDGEGDPLPVGTPEAGRVAVTGYLPLGYHNDPQKTAETFVERDGIRYVLPGDWATFATDGTLLFLGRGTSCINTGGEKVFAEEVEATLKMHPGVRDAVVVGRADPRFGQRIVAVVRAAQRVTRPPSEADLIRHVKARLAAYKAPREIVFVEEIARTPAGKVDYDRVRALILD